jgi:ABC-type cobalamin transport system permease subunit
MPKSWGEIANGCITDPNQPANFKCLEAVVANLITLFVSLAGLALFVMFVIGAFLYLTAGADPKKAEKARNTMLYAVIGIVLMILSYIILAAIEYFTGVELTTFTIPFFPAP